MLILYKKSIIIEWNEDDVIDPMLPRDNKLMHSKSYIVGSVIMKVAPSPRSLSSSILPP